MTTTWWRMSTYRGDCVPVEVVKETAKTITLAATDKKWYSSRERTVRKDSSYERYFPTEREAWEWAKAKATLAVSTAERELDYAQVRLQEITDRMAKLPPVVVNSGEATGGGDEH